MLATGRRPPAAPESDYRELRLRLLQAGVFKPQPVYYATQAISLVALVALSLTLLFLIDALWLQLLNAALLAFAFVQLGFIFHDAGHRQILTRGRHNDIVMHLAGFIVGSSRSWWFDSHNRHHAHPNELDLDPDTELYIVNFTDGQASRRPWLVRQITRLQGYYFFPVLAFEGIGVHIVSLAFLARSKARFRALEALALVAHLAIYGGLILLALPVLEAIVFMAAHHCLAGLYMGSVFAPNHKGMLVPDPNSTLDLFHRQVLTSRNIAPSAFVDMWYGGLNYQIEHHLFPKIPRSNLRAARLVTIQYCREQGIPYHETSMWGSFVEITRHLKQVVPASQRRPAASAAISD